MLDLLDDEVESTEGYDTVVDLDVYDDAEFKDRIGEQYEYPCITINNITSQEEYNFLQRREVDESASLPLFCLVDGVVQRIGKIDVTLDTMLSLRQIYDYDVWLLKSKEEKVKLDLNDTSLLVKLIRV